LTFYSFLFIYKKYCELFAKQAGIIYTISGLFKKDAFEKSRDQTAF